MPNSNISGHFRKEHRQWVEESIHSHNGNAREPEWTEGIAVGSKTFVDGIKENLQPKLSGLPVRGNDDHYELREQRARYDTNFGPKKGF